MGTRKSILQREQEPATGAEEDPVRVLEAKRVECCKKDSLPASRATGKHPLAFPTRKLLEKSRRKAHSV